MHNPESVLDNETHTFLCDFEKQMEHESDSDTKCNWCFWYNLERIGTRTRGILNKRTSRGQYKTRYDLAGKVIHWELKLMEHESDSDTKCNWCSWYNHERIGTMD